MGHSLGTRRQPCVNQLVFACGRWSCKTALNAHAGGKIASSVVSSKRSSSSSR